MEAYMRAYAEACRSHEINEARGEYELALAYIAEAAKILWDLSRSRSIPINRRIFLNTEYKKCLSKIQKLQEQIALNYSYIAPSPDAERPSSPVVYPDTPKSGEEEEIDLNNVVFDLESQPLKVEKDCIFISCKYCECDATARLFTKEVSPEEVSSIVKEWSIDRHPCNIIAYGQWVKDVTIKGVTYTSGIVMEPIGLLFSNALEILATYSKAEKTRIGKEIARGLARLMAYIGGKEIPCAAIDISVVAVSLSLNGPVTVKRFDNFGDVLVDGEILFSTLGEAVDSDKIKRLGIITKEGSAYDLLREIESL